MLRFYIFALPVLLIGTMACNDGSAGTASERTAGLPPNPDGFSRWTNLPLHYCVDDRVRSDGDVGNFDMMIRQAFSDWGTDAIDDGRCVQPGR